MALTSNDETDLLLPLYRGLDETPRFATFVDRLRRRAGTKRAYLLLDGDETADFAGLPESAMRGALRPYRAYPLAELDGAPDANGDARIVMFTLPDGTRGWLVIARDRPCSAADSALLSSLAPYVQTVVSKWQERQRERAAAALSSNGLARTGTGWILFDADARVLDIAQETQQRLAGLTGSAPTIGERLRGVRASAERRLAEAAALGKGTGTTVLLSEPRVDAVLRQIEPGSMAARAFPRATLIAWCRFECTEAPERVGNLACLYDLPQREAELAVALADGRSIAEAASAMGLTLETARNYSKRLYAKLGVSGQAQLVRLVLRSGAVLA